MAAHCCAGATVPMSVRTLSFTVVQFLYVAVSVKTCGKSAVFRHRVMFQPTFLALPKTFAFSRLLYPLDDSVVFTVDLLRGLRIHWAYRVPYI